MSKTTAIIIFIITILFLGGGLYLATSKSTTPSGVLTADFAKCLTEKGMVMYGAYWCSHCQKVKQDFGNNFQYIKYVECTMETQTCTDKSINGYPTFIFADGSRIEGAPNYPDLASKTSCGLGGI